MLADFLHKELRPLHPVAEGRAVTMHWLSEQLAAHHRISFAEALSALGTLSPNLMPLFDSAQGIAALGMATSLMLPDPNPDPFVTLIH